MFLNHPFFKKGLLALLIPFSAANAEIIIHGTRVIYPSDAREITLQVSNNGNKPALVQAWIDEGDAKSTPDQSKAPFMIAPPISRVEAKKGQSLRISSMPKANELSKTQETLFWLNILDIPPKPSAKEQNVAPENFLQLAIRSRIKFFYRPSGIKEDVVLAPEKLQWSNSGSHLTIKNPTPFYITLTSIMQEQAGKRVDLLAEGLMLKPFSDGTVNLKGANVTKMTFTTINDYGGRVERNIKFQ
ncbi:fimbria/pilus periplasmic chaperone [Acinetobacter sp.]|jgi:P pilus assembly chaperone PapD|uniref:fimbrial biogenesis chaperone n=1 Tax=Acinetobacter sp. TaxID=472 RepID=UPI0028366E60|nr:fimbria/pilus periplasmic chaperone [Acinetobacter sp.]MDR0237843.1 fimbria/pilus periplasmic chaperone [Acinetobacter sp.]